MKSPKAISYLFFGSAIFGSLHAGDALDLINQLEWESSPELSIPSATKEWGKPTLLGITGSRVGSFNYDKGIRSTGTSSEARNDSTSDDTLGFGDLMGDDDSSNSDQLDLDDLMGDDSSSNNDTDLDLGGLLDDSSDVMGDTLDLGDLMSESETTNENVEENIQEKPLAETSTSQSNKPSSSALGTGTSHSQKEVNITKTTPDDEQHVFHFTLGQVHVYWQHGYAASEARITTTGSFTIEHFLEAIDQPGLLEVHKNSHIKDHLQDSVQLQFTQARLADVLNWISDAYKAPYNLKNRSLHL
jgi:hypothetical protein